MIDQAGGQETDRKTSEKLSARSQMASSISSVLVASFSSASMRRCAAVMMSTP
jgi:hypothetical protein